MWIRVDQFFIGKRDKLACSRSKRTRLLVLSLELYALIQKWKCWEVLTRTSKPRFKYRRRRLSAETRNLFFKPLRWSHCKHLHPKHFIPDYFQAICRQNVAVGEIAGIYDAIIINCTASYYHHSLPSDVHHWGKVKLSKTCVSLYDEYNSRTLVVTTNDTYVPRMNLQRPAG